MAKILIKSAKLTPFGGIFSIMEQFRHNLDTLCGGFCYYFNFNLLYHLEVTK